MVAIVLVIAAAAVLLVSSPGGQKACTMEAKICPDGTAVGRTGPNCEFAPCPNATGMPNPASVYCEEQGSTLIIVEDSGGVRGAQAGYCNIAENVACEEWEFFRSNGTNCTSESGVTKTYLKKGNCVINFLCIQGTQAFKDSYGCGCEPAEITNFEECANAGYPIMESYPRQCRTPDGQTFTEVVPEKHYCTPEQRGAEICTMEYRPVCGWFNQSILCFAYPCAQTYSNPCMACAEDKVAYWTEGECPKTVNV